MSTAARLRLMRKTDIQTQVEKAVCYLPHSRMVHGFLTIGVPRGAVNYEKTKFYIPENPDLPFFMVISEAALNKTFQHATLFWNPKEVPRDTAKQLLQSLPNWNWTVPTFFNAVTVPVLRELEALILGKSGLGENKLQLTVAGEGYLYEMASVIDHVPKYQENELDLDFLSDHYANLVSERWQYQRYYDEEYVENAMRALPAVAAFRRTKATTQKLQTADENGCQVEEKVASTGLQPVSWAILKANGEIGCTFTEPEYRNRGLASAVTSKLCQELLKMNITPAVLINHEAYSSRKLHLNIGFQNTGVSVGWHMYYLCKN